CRSTGTWPAIRSTLPPTGICRIDWPRGRRQTRSLASSSPAAASPLRSALALLPALGLVERPVSTRHALRFAQHLEAHGSSQRRHFDQTHLNPVGQLIAP